MQLEKTVERIVGLASKLALARAEVAELEAELAGLLGGAKPEKAAAAPRKKLQLSTGVPAKRGERQEQVVALAKEGLDVQAIAARLGVAARVVNMALWRARKAGLLPKAGAKET